MIRNGAQVKDSRVDVLGAELKGNCADIRNARVIDVIHELKSHGAHVVHVHDRCPTRRSAPVHYQAARGLYTSKVVDSGCFVDVKSQFDMTTQQGR